MLFKTVVLDRIARGEVSLAFRRWSRPTVKPGGTLRTAIGVLAIDEVKEVLLADIDRDDARRAGYETLAALTADLRRGTDGRLFRIAFRLAGPDPRLELREQDDLDANALAEIAEALRRVEARGPEGWVLSVLRSISEREGHPAADLAATLGMDKPGLKRRVRQLKELGLTESLERGYRLSARGDRVLSALDQNGAGGADGRPARGSDDE